MRHAILVPAKLKRTSLESRNIVKLALRKTLSHVQDHLFYSETSKIIRNTIFLNYFKTIFIHLNTLFWALVWLSVSCRLVCSWNSKRKDINFLHLLQFSRYMTDWQWMNRSPCISNKGGAIAITLYCIHVYNYSTTSNDYALYDNITPEKICRFNIVVRLQLPI